MVIASGGNVGIGTTAPGEPLEVNGTILADNLVQSQGIKVKDPSVLSASIGLDSARRSLG